MGPIANVFDGDVHTLARTDRVNPAVIEIRFRTPTEIGGVIATTSSMDLRMTVRLFEVGRAEPEVKEQIFANLPPDPTVRLPIVPPARSVENVSGEIEELHVALIAHSH